ncbi:hypothetical protein PsAD46_03760 [Pseudovibrio sp. Ad46]|nr:hypothetical protein PsAD46_03760 [Pseudovibrio sp. Ad46]KZK98925.1 hypothetical protein PsAD5_01548 [Pseudovibrio sp. Ad5]
MAVLTCVINWLFGQRTIAQEQQSQGGLSCWSIVLLLNAVGSNDCLINELHEGQLEGAV